MYKLIKVKDCSIEQIVDYVNNKLENYDIIDVSICQDTSVLVEYWNARGEPSDLLLDSQKRIKIEVN